MFASLRRLVPRRLLRLGRFPRLCAVGICLLLAAQSAVAQRRTGPGAGRTVPVLVSARTLPAGHVLTAGDLHQARWPATARPPGAPARAAALIGHRLAGPVGVGEPITATRLIGRDLAAGLSADVVATAVPLADPHTAELVRPGDRVELLSTRRTDDLSAPRPGGVEEVVPGARVLAVLSDPDAGVELVIAVSRAIAGRIARDGPTHVFTAVLAPP